MATAKTTDKQIPGTTAYITAEDPHAREFLKAVKKWRTDEDAIPEAADYIGYLMATANHSESDFSPDVQNTLNEFANPAGKYAAKPVYRAVMQVFRQLASSLVMPDDTKFNTQGMTAHNQQKVEVKSSRVFIQLAQKTGGKVQKGVLPYSINITIKDKAAYQQEVEEAVAKYQAAKNARKSKAAAKKSTAKNTVAEETAEEVVAEEIVAEVVAEVVAEAAAKKRKAAAKKGKAIAKKAADVSLPDDTTSSDAVSDEREELVVKPKARPMHDKGKIGTRKGESTAKVMPQVEPTIPKKRGLFTDESALQADIQKEISQWIKKELEDEESVEFLNQVWREELVHTEIPYGRYVAARYMLQNKYGMLKLSARAGAGGSARDWDNARKELQKTGDIEYISTMMDAVDEQIRKSTPQYTKPLKSARYPPWAIEARWERHHQIIREYYLAVATSTHQLANREIKKQQANEARRAKRAAKKAEKAKQAEEAEAGPIDQEELAKAVVAQAQRVASGSVFGGD